MQRRINLSSAIVFVLFFGMSHTKLTAQWQHIGAITSWNKEGNEFTLRTESASVRIAILSDDIIRVRLAPSGKFEEDFSYAVVKKNWDAVAIQSSETDSSIEISTASVRVSVARKPCRISFNEKATGRLIAADDRRRGMASDGEAIRVWKWMPELERYYGFGEKTASLEKRGQSMVNWNTDIPAYRASTDPLYQTIPFFMALRDGKAYGIFFDNTYRSIFDVGKELRDVYSFGADGGELNYYFLNGPTPKEISARFSELIGTMPLPPKWALGYQQSRWSYYPDSTVRNLAATFRSKNIPCDVIYLDIHYMNGYRVFTWDSTRFSNPKKLLSDLARDGFHVVPIIDPGIKKDESYSVYRSAVKENVFVKNPDGSPFIGPVWPGDCVFPDFTSPPTRDWWGRQFSELLAMGMTGFWNDMNEPSVFGGPGGTMPLHVRHSYEGRNLDHRASHNVYGLGMARATFEGVRSVRPDIRPFVLTRAGYAGIQRYAAIWSGDNISSWEHLYQGLPTLMNLSISGQPFIGEDIGGFVYSPTGELFTRWLQKGVFHPFCRVHSEIYSNPQEPWSYGEKFEAINKRYIELRYELMPFLYTQFWKASRTGIPIMRPLFYNYPSLEKFAKTEDEFMIGDDILVAPVLRPADSARFVFLPPGKWYSFWTDELLPEGDWQKISAPIDTMPFFIREGSIIPMQSIVQHTGVLPDALILHVYPDSNGTAHGEMYEDRGEGYEYLKGEYRLTHFDYLQSNRQKVFSLRTIEGSYVMEGRRTMVVIHGVREIPGAVSINSTAMHRSQSESDPSSAMNGWYYESEKRRLVLCWMDVGIKEVIIR